MSHLPDVAAEIPFGRVRDFFHEVGIPTKDLLEVTIGLETIEATYIARDAAGQAYSSGPDAVARQRLTVKLVR